MQLRAHTETNACTVWAKGVTYPLRDPTCGVVGGQTAAFAIEDTVLGSANITTTSWDRNARSGTELTDGRGAYPLHLPRCTLRRLIAGSRPAESVVSLPSVRLSLLRADHDVLCHSRCLVAAPATSGEETGARL